MDVQEYLVTLGIRPAELSGLKELPGTTKDRLTPIVLLAPWLATTPLSRALDKFEEAYPARPYFVDVDTYYRINDKPNGAKELWARLADKPADLDAWWGLLADYPNANPCLLMAQQPIERVRDQIAWARVNNRTFCLRMNLAEGIGSGIPQWMTTLVTELAEEGATDYVVVFEFGWVQDPLWVAAVASGYTNTFFSSIPPTIPVAISCTSFPKDFTAYDGMEETAFTNRELVAQVQRTTNRRKSSTATGGQRGRGVMATQASPRTGLTFQPTTLGFLPATRMKAWTSRQPPPGSPAATTGRVTSASGVSS